MVRLRVAFVVIAMVVSVFGARLVQLQGVDPQAYAARAEAAGLVNVALPARRGSILDRDGDPLAESLDGMMLVADPTLVDDDAPAVARIVADHLSVDYFDVLQRLRRTDTRFQYLARRVPAERATKVLRLIHSHGYEGVSSRRDPVRDYPAGDVAANILGFMGASGKPMAGFERMFDAELSGQDGRATYEVGGGNRIPLGENSVEQPTDGQDLRLTIDRDVQWYTQRVLRQTVEDAAGESGTAVVMDTETGEVLSLADYPTFDANKPLSSPEDDLGSKALQDVYEPGSVEKVLTAASLIDAGKVTPRTKITVPGELHRGDRVIHDYWVHPRLHLTLTGVIAKSSNIGTVLATEQLSAPRLRGYLADFGLGEPTGVGVPGESRGILPPTSNWSPIKKDTIAFGQGLAVNGLQMAAAVNTVANGGMRISPSLVEGSETTRNQRTVGTETTTAHRVVSKHAAAATTRMMEMVTDPDKGTAPAAAIQGYRVAGKTGTAQRVGADCGCYDGTYAVSFAGFAPADQPRFLVYVVVQNPRNGGGGGSVGGPAFHKIMSYLLRKYAVPPTGSKPPKTPLEW